MVLRSSLLTQLRTPTAVLGVRPVDINSGIDITSWKIGDFMPRVALAYFDGDATSVLSPVDAKFGAGVELYGWKNTFAKWELVALLTMAGANIQIVSAGLGVVLELNDLAPFDRLACAASVSGGANVTYRFAPMETWGGGL